MKSRQTDWCLLGLIFLTVVVGYAATPVAEGDEAANNARIVDRYEDSRDSFKIGHDIRILKEVFKQDPGGYAHENF